MLKFLIQMLHEYIRIQWTQATCFQVNALIVGCIYIKIYLLLIVYFAIWYNFKHDEVIATIQVETFFAMSI